MKIYDIIINKLNNYPQGFGPDEVDTWLKIIPEIENLKNIEAVFLSGH